MYECHVSNVPDVLAVGIQPAVSERAQPVGGDRRTVPVFLLHEFAGQRVRADADPHQFLHQRAHGYQHTDGH